MSRSHTALRVPAGHVDLVGEFAGEADPRDPHVHAVEGGVAPGHERERFVGDVQVGEHRADDVARSGPDHREGVPLLGDRGHPHPQVWPLGLQPFLHPVEDVGRAAGGGEHLEPVLGQAHHGAVVDDHAVDAAHHAVAHHPDLESAHHVRVEHVEELAGIGTLHVDLAERGAVEDADTAAHRGTLAQHRGLHVLAGQRVVARTLPLPDVLEHRTAGDVPIVHGGHAFGIEEAAAAAAGQCRERHRSVGRAERGGAHVLDRHAEQFRGDARRDDARRLALIVRGADRGVALDVFDRADAGTDGADEVGHRRVALDVDELPVCASGVGDLPQHLGGPGDDDLVRLTGERRRRQG